MAGAKEIRTQIASIKNTQKITSAMQMVAAAKMRKAQDRMAATRPYAEKIRRVIGHLHHAHPEYKHSIMQEREVKRIGYIVVSSDRGLCGGLNNNLFRKLVKEIKIHSEAGIDVDFCIIGNISGMHIKYNTATHKLARTIDVYKCLSIGNRIDLLINRPCCRTARKYYQENGTNECKQSL